MAPIDDLREAGYDAGLAYGASTDEDGQPLQAVVVVRSGERNADPALSDEFLIYLPEDQVRGFLNTAVTPLG